MNPFLVDYGTCQDMQRQRPSFTLPSRADPFSPSPKAYAPGNFPDSMLPEPLRTRFRLRLSPRSHRVVSSHLSRSSLTSPDSTDLVFGPVSPESRLKRARSVRDAFPPKGLTAANLAQLNGYETCDSTDMDSFSEMSDSPSELFLPLATPTKRRPAWPEPHAIFQIPELVCRIVECVEAMTSDPFERPVVRRKHPDGRRHEDLLQAKGSLHLLLLVNRLFSRITTEVLGRRLHFARDRHFALFAALEPAKLAEFHPAKFVLRQAVHTRQRQLDHVAQHVDFSGLTWLEIYMCPGLVPPPQMLPPTLHTLVVTGSAAVDDAWLLGVARRCPHLSVLDLRACELVLDVGVHVIGQNCRRLHSVNLGRKRRGLLITDHSVAYLVRQNPRLHTVGLAGCAVLDRSLWELAAAAGPRLQRLSLNNCTRLTNQLVPALLLRNMFPRLLVLEVRNVLGITYWDPVVTFRRRQSARGIYLLIEVCEQLAAGLKACEQRMDAAVTQRIYNDITAWANAPCTDAPGLPRRT